MNETGGILWSIDDDGVMRIAKSENGDGTIPVTPATGSEKEYNDEGYERTVFTFEGVFYKPWSREEGERVTEVIIEPGITKIPFGTFSDFRRLVRITVPDSVRSIGKWAFRSCEELEQIILPEGIGEIGDETFLGCHRLNGPVIPSGVTSIGKKAFSFCKSMTEIDLPEGLRYIGEEAFSFCHGLKKITIPDSVEFIGRDAFKPCNNLRKAYVPADKIDRFGNAFAKPDYNRNTGTTLSAKRGRSIFARLFKK